MYLLKLQIDIACQNSKEYWAAIFSVYGVFALKPRQCFQFSYINKNPDVFIRTSQVVYTEQEAADLGLEIDHDDSHCLGDKPFALLVHGSQRANTEASKALSKRKKEGGFVGYSK